MEAHRIDATIGEHGELILKHLPFAPGESVEALILSRAVPVGDSDTATSRNSVLEYRDPFEPVAIEDWESLR